jgi:hypothetical protein
MKAPLGSLGALDLTPSNQRRIKVLFYSFASPNEGTAETIQTRVSACWTRDPEVDHVITHCELRFSNGYATSITSSSNRVHYEQRLHSRENYCDVIEYHVSAETEAQMQAEAQRMAEDPSIQFNYSGFVWNFVPILRYWPVRQNMKQVFCSELVVYLLQLGGFLTRLDPACTSPMMLFKAASEDVTNGIAHLSWNREYGKFIHSARGGITMNF